MKKLKLFCTIFFILPLVFTETIELGMDDQWNSLYKMDGISFEKGYKGYRDIILKDGQYNFTGDTDLLYHFDGTMNPLGNYRLIQGDPKQLVALKKYGNMAANFNNQTSTLVLEAVPGAIFYPGNNPLDFSMEFWFFAYNLEKTSDLFRWQGTIQDGNEFRNQLIECRITDRKIQWNFENFFYDPRGTETTVFLESLRSLIPAQWNHVLLRYDFSLGRLELLINGEVEAISYSTDNGVESASIYHPFVGQQSPKTLAFGTNFNGVLDEIRFLNYYCEEPNLAQYSFQPGILESRIIDLGYSGTYIYRIESRFDTPGNTELLFYYKVSDERLGNEKLPGNWQVFDPREDLNIRGQYLKIRVELLSDGYGQLSPSLSYLRVVYEPDMPPPPPVNLKAESMDGAVRLSWNSVKDMDVKGYKIYFGTKPGQYFGSSDILGSSPIDVGNVTSFIISGLKNGQLYFFTVVAYDNSMPPHESVFSKELGVRPLKK